MTSDLLWISRQEVQEMDISMSEIMDAVETGFIALAKGAGEMPAKIAIHPREDCFIHAMPCYLGGDLDLAGVKIISGYTTNPAKKLPYISGLMILNDPDTGLPMAAMDAGLVTARRTGAASGVYARHFGHPDTETVTLVGTGVQARANLLAMAEVFPKLKQARCYNPRKASMETFVGDMGPSLPGLQFKTFTDLRAAVEGTDVLITCTPMVENPERPIRRDWLGEDCLVISVDYDAALHQDVFQGANFVCDHRDQYLKTRDQGVYFQNGYPGPDEIFADMGEICAGREKGQRFGRRGAVLMGIGSHDIMAASLIYERAVANGIGTRVGL